MSDLARYFDVTGCRPDGAPSADALARLQLAHMLAFPFENLNPLSGNRVLLDLPALVDKFTARRGGYCFEQNLLYRQALQSLGFRTTPLLARVRANVPEDVVTPRTHMLLLVDVDGERLISDTGFGKMTPTAPLRLVPDVVQQTPHGRYRLVQVGDMGAPAQWGAPSGEYRLEAEIDGTWAALYQFDLRPHWQPDFEMSNWYVSTHPASHFTRDLIAVRTVATGRHVLHNTRYSLYGPDTIFERRELTSGPELMQLLESTFDLAAERVPGLAAKLDAIAARDPASAS
ncbi:N-hydroxyarylamine O-acetyltransferase [Pseudoduganella flava]|uniref:Arylamine N-acetyltransferase n=1 Tax=Pseudoduganella flava TaxID=871742 RepID=A0A562PZD7_9BURK|nr:arylamine N-acetyltransferase [Pseudoduganella flava]QGZ38618.1 arylamine N-acetyltransferase [Pseudoduganella flava]TWI49811.1 N-hydroxyarylamine O-acetyltransferase [Pseudoduganella flava]